MSTAIADEVKQEVVRLDVDASAQARSILFHAYRDEPTFRYLFDIEKPGYDQRVRATIREVIATHFAHQHDALGVVVDGNLVAVAFIGDARFRMELANQFSWRIRMILTAGPTFTSRYLDYHRQVARCLPSEEHHQLPFLGVHPRYQNKGYGRLLIGAVHRICEDNPVSCGVGLDTGSTRYRALYESLGYRQVGTVPIGELQEVVLFRRHNRNRAEVVE